MKDEEIINRYLNGESSYQIGKQYGKKLQDIIYVLKRNGIKRRSTQESRHRKYSLDDNFFSNIDTPEKAYFLGWMYSDGCLPTNTHIFKISLHKDDKHILEEFKKCIRYTGPLYESKRDGQFCLAVSSMKACSDLFKLGCIHKKSLVLKFPTESQVPKILINDFIRGYFDGDGSVCNTKRLISSKVYYEPSVQIIGSNEFIEGLFLHLKDIGFEKISKGFTNSNKNSVVYIKRKKEIIQFYDTFYKNSKTYLYRKNKKFLELLDYYKDKKFYYSCESIDEFYNDGVFKKSWDSLSQIEENLGIRRDCVLKCIRGVLKTSNGSIWKVKV